MRQVPDCEDEPVPEIPQVTPPKKKRRMLIQVKPLPPAGKGILISPGFRCVKVWCEICEEENRTETHSWKEFFSFVAVSRMIFIQVT